jgi:hypothetical protein
MSAPAQELHVKQDDANALLPQGSPEIVMDDADEVMAGFGFTEIAVEVPKAKKRKTETLSPEKPAADAENAEAGDTDADVIYTKEGLGFDPKKKCRLPKCMLMKKVGQPVCGPHRKQKEAVRLQRIRDHMCFQCELVVTTPITESLCPLPINSLSAEHAYQLIVS